MGIQTQIGLPDVDVPCLLRSRLKKVDWCQYHPILLSDCLVRPVNHGTLSFRVKTVDTGTRVVTVET